MSIQVKYSTSLEDYRLMNFILTNRSNELSTFSILDAANAAGLRPDQVGTAINRLFRVAVQLYFDDFIEEASWMRRYDFNDRRTCITVELAGWLVSLDIGSLDDLGCME